MTPTTDGDSETTTTGDPPPVTITVDPDTTVGMDTTDGETTQGTTEDTTQGETTQGETTEGAVCGNGKTEAGEDCDGDDLGGEDCESQGFGGGRLACTDDCMFDTSGCAKLACGNDMIDKGETCDGTDLGGEDCESQGFGGGTLACAGDCMGFDTANCMEVPVQDCCQPQMGLTGCSEPACEAAVCAIDDYCCNMEWDDICVEIAVAEAACAGTGTCPAAGVCGDGAIGFGEACDGAELGGEDCVSQGFLGGVLACAGDCTTFDTTNCMAPPEGMDCCLPQMGLVGCPDAACEAAICAADDYCCLTEWDQLCVDAALAEAACAGAGSCPAPGVCGDGAIGFGEACDGANLDGLDCVQFGYAGGGALACAADCTAFDTGGCNANLACSEQDLASATGAAVAMGTTVGADNDLNASCGGTGGPDRVLTFTAATSGVYTFDTLGSGYDTKLAMFLECNVASEIVCNDDEPGGTVQSQIAVNLPAGQVVLLVVDGYNGATGNWVLNITGP